MKGRESQGKNPTLCVSSHADDDLSIGAIPREEEIVFPAILSPIVYFLRMTFSAADAICGADKPYLSNRSR